MRDETGDVRQETRDRRLKPIYPPKLKKRMQKKVAFFKRTEKNGAFRTEKNAVPNPGIRHHGYWLNIVFKKGVPKLTL